MENAVIFAAEAEDSVFGGNGARVELASAEAHDDAVTDGAVADLRALIETAQVVVPEGATVVRVNVRPGEVIELPFGPDAHFTARLGDGNLAIKVGDAVVILEGYNAAAAEKQPVIEASNGQPLDIASILAATDPDIDIQTAAGPAAGPQGQGADNTGGIFTQFGEAGGPGGFTGGAGAQEGTDDLTGGTVAQNGTLFREFGTTSAPPLAAAQNTAPVAHDDLYLAIQYSQLVVSAANGVLANDTDADGDTLKASISGPAHGGLAFSPDGSFTYYPQTGYVGSDSFKYMVSDGNGGTAEATVNLYVDALPVLAQTAQSRNEDDANASTTLVINDIDDTTHTISVDPDTLPPGVTFDPATRTLNYNTLGLYDYLAAGEMEDFTIKFTITDGHGASVIRDFTLTMNGLADAGPLAVDDTILTNVGIDAGAILPSWAMVANDKDSSTQGLAAAGASTGLADHTVFVGDYRFKDDGTLGGQGTLFTSSALTVDIKNQQGGDLTGTTAHEIILSGSAVGAGDKIDGKGGKDIIFGGAGDDTVIFHNGDIVIGGGDSIAKSNALPTAAGRGDVLAIDHDVDFVPLNLAHSGGIETLSTAAADGGAGAQSLTIGAAQVNTLSDHTITPGNTVAGVFAEEHAIRIDGDAVDQLYLSISKDPVAGGGWADTGLDVNGYRVYAHETTAGDAATADAYVMVSNAIPTANVHLNQDQV